MREQREGFQHAITFKPAFDKRHSDPKKNYGIGAMQMGFTLLGPKGATHFLMSTGWHLPRNQQEMTPKEAEWMLEHGYPLSFRPQAWDVGYHSPTPQFEDQTERDCDLLPGGKCYSDGSALQAKPILDRFLAKGEDAIWRELYDRYDSRFADVAEAAHVG